MTITKSNWQQLADRVAKNRASSFWLQDALKTALRRDCVDAANDAEFLSDLMRARADSVLSLGGRYG